MRTRKKYTKEFKLEAVRLARQPGVTAREIAEDLGISESVLHRWKKALSVDGDQAFPGNGRLKSDDEEIRQLKLEVRRLREERDILEKAALFFAEEDKRRGRGR